MNNQKTNEINKIIDDLNNAIAEINAMHEYINDIKDAFVYVEEQLRELNE